MHTALIARQRGLRMAAVILLFAAGGSNAYISKAVCFRHYQRYLQPAFEGTDTSGFPGFRSYVDSCSFDQKYHLFDSLKAVLFDSLAMTWKSDYLMFDVIQPIFYTFWEPLYLHDDAFFRYALLQCEGRVIGSDAGPLSARFPTQNFTIWNIKDQRWVLGEHPDSNICLRNNYSFVDSIATLILADGDLPKSYRSYFAGMDKYIEPTALNSGDFSLKIDSTFKGKGLNNMVTIDSSFIAVAGDSGLIAVSIDAGSHWRTSAPFTSNDITAIGFLTKAKGFCIENRMNIWSTKDSGTTWQQTDISPGMPQKMIVFDSTRLLLLDDFNGNVWSGDGGATWTKTPVLFNYTTSVINRNCAYGLGYDRLGTRQVRKTTDGGATWSDICLLDTSYHPATMTFLDEQTGLIGGNLGEVAVTTDGGIHWQQFSLPTVENIVAILCLSDRTIIAITDGFSVFSTGDTGDTWTIEKVYFPTRLTNGVQMADRRSVWLGSDGLLVFCQSPAVAADAPGRKGMKPIMAIPTHLHAATSYTLDGKRTPARIGAQGLRLTHGSAGNGKTVLVR